MHFFKKEQQPTPTNSSFSYGTLDSICNSLNRRNFRVAATVAMILMLDAGGGSDGVAGMEGLGGGHERDTGGCNDRGHGGGHGDRGHGPRK